MRLEENPNNFYSVEDVGELKASIKEYGVKQPLIVRPIEDDKYRIIAGHRRYRACQELVQEGCDYLEFVPCLVEDHIDDWIEEILLIHTNSTSRTLSDWEKIEQIKKLKKLLSAAKKENKVPGRVREQLADVLDVSSATIGRMEQVDKNLKKEFKNELKKKTINMNTAVEISKLSAEQQEEVYKKHIARGGSTTAKDIEVKKVATVVLDKPEPVEYAADDEDLVLSVLIEVDDFRHKLKTALTEGKTVKEQAKNIVIEKVVLALDVLAAEYEKRS